MNKKIVFSVFILLVIGLFSISAATEKDVMSSLFFQYSFDNDFTQIDSVGAYMRLSKFNDSQLGSSFGSTFELPIGYSNDKMSLKYSIFGGPSVKFIFNEIDNLMTIGPSITVTLLSDTYYTAAMIDMGILIDGANSYPVSEKINAIVGASLIFDIARYYVIETFSTTDNDFSQDFFQLSGKFYLGFSITR